MTPKSVFGHELTSSDKVGVARMRAFLANGKDFYDVDKGKLDAAISERAVKAEVKTNDIYPSQSYINRERVESYVKSPQKNLSDRTLGITGYRLPNGKVILDDGHHRVAASIIRGDKMVSMNVVDVNEYYAKKFFKSLSRKR